MNIQDYKPTAEQLNNIRMKKYPSDFTNHPLSSVMNKCEYETIAQNIMIILKRTGDKFRRLSWKEYKAERMKDSDFSDIEKLYFDSVSKYCLSANKAKTFSPSWEDKK